MAASNLNGRVEHGAIFSIQWHCCPSGRSRGCLSGIGSEGGTNARRAGAVREKAQSGGMVEERALEPGSEEGGYQVQFKLGDRKTASFAQSRW